MTQTPHMARASLMSLLLLAQLAPGQKLDPFVVREPPQPGDARVVLTLDKPSFFLGENVLIHYCIENVSHTPFSVEFGGDGRAASRSTRFKMTVTDAAGDKMPDPDPAQFNLGGLMVIPSVDPGGKQCESLPLMRFARIDRPGTYTVRVSHDHGWKNIKPPEGQATVTLTMPNAQEAERVVETMLRLPNDGRVLGQQSRDWQDFSALRYPIYLAPLTNLADGGNKLAVTGIGSIPTPEATRALIGMLDRPDHEFALLAVRTLAMRLPDPALDGSLPARGPFDNGLEDPRKYLRDASWRPEFAADVRKAAAKWLEASDAPDVIQGAFMLEAVGTAADTPVLTGALTRALERTVTLPFEKGGYPRPRGAMAELLRAAEVLVARGAGMPQQVREPGDAAMWLVAFGKGARPREWEARMRELLEHRLAYIRELALKHLPAGAPAELTNAVAPALLSADMDLQIAALEVIRREKLVAYRTGVSAIARSTGDDMLRNFASNALYVVGGRVEVLEIAVDQLKATKLKTITTLFSVFDDIGGWGGAPVSDEDTDRLVARWRKFITEHRDALESGRKFSLDDPSVQGLIPPGWPIRRKGKTLETQRARPVSRSRPPCYLQTYL